MKVVLYGAWWVVGAGCQAALGVAWEQEGVAGGFTGTQPPHSHPRPHRVSGVYGTEATEARVDVWIWAGLGNWWIWAVELLQILQRMING